MTKLVHDNTNKEPDPIAPKFDEKNFDERKALAEQAHPLVQGLTNAAAIMGRDIGVLSLRSIEANRVGGLSACLYWTADRVPEAIKAQMSKQMQDNLHGAMVVPHGATVPSFTFADTMVRTASRNVVDGSQLIVFEKVAGETVDDASA